MEDFSLGTLALVAFLSFMTGLIVGGSIEQELTQQQVVKMHYAQYNPQTAEFEWLTPKEIMKREEGSE